MLGHIRLLLPPGLVAAAALAVVLMAACGGTGGSTEPAVYTEADSGRTVQAAVGDTIVVRLPENPSTGYAWTATPSDGLEPLADDFVAPSSSPALVGAPGTRVLKYEVTASGTQSVEASYQRSWEAGTVEPAQEFALTIDVE
jgi:inhibitor of cysteine peptidase